MISSLLTRRATFSGLAFAAYGLWEVYARWPGGLGTRAFVLSSLLAVALFAAGGIILSLAIAGVAVGVGQAAPIRWRAALCASLETCLWVPLVLWLIFNEVVYSTTCEVIGYDTLAMTWHNPGATFQNAWQMGGRYLVGTVIATVVLSAAIWLLSWRSFRTEWPSRAKDLLSPSFHLAQVRPASNRFIGSLTGGVMLLVVLLAWQISTKPGAALATVLRSAPPIRAFNLTRAILGDDLKQSGQAAPTGAPIVSDDQYAASLKAGAREISSTPNIILIVLESVSAPALHCYGHSREDVSPHMDALARSGVMFEHCWSAASFSSYGLLSLMTSLYLLRDEVNDHFTDHSFPFMSLPRAFKLAGYETAIFSSGNETFDHINDVCRPADFDRYYTQDTPRIQHPDSMRMDDHFAVEQFEKWMGERKTQKPFYVSFYLQSTHFDYAVPEPWSQHYQPTPPLLGNGNAVIKIPPDVLPLLRNQYDNALRYSDYWVGRIVESLKKENAFDNCAIAIIGDHGEAFMEHGLARHGVHLWEEMIHVPLILYVGDSLRTRLGQPLSARVPDTVSSIDVAPTLAALAGVAPHPSWQGVDILSSAYTSKDRPIFSVLQLTRWQEAVTVNKLNYLYDLSNVEEFLFDLATDPEERDNLIDKRHGWRDIMLQLLSTWHTHQLSYYSFSNRPFSRYIGMPAFDLSLIGALRQHPASQPEGKTQLE